jgi:hypothetical protein
MLSSAEKGALLYLFRSRAIFENTIYSHSLCFFGNTDQLTLINTPIYVFFSSIDP